MSNKNTNEKTYTITQQGLQQLQHQVDNILDMLNNNTDRHNIIEEVYDMANNLRKITMPAAAEQLTDDKMRELFGAKYKNIIYYNFDLDTWNTMDVTTNQTATTAMQNMKSAMQSERAFNRDIAACAIMPIAWGHKGIGQIIQNPTYSQFGKYIVGTVVCRDNNTGKILPLPHDWMCGDVFSTPENAIASAPITFPTRLSENAILRRQLIKLYRHKQR